MKFSKINYITLEKIALILFLIIVASFSIYYFVEEINWVKLYSDKDSKNIYAGSAENENCFKCHRPVSGFSEYHDPAKLGCSSCHLGNTTSTDKVIAHTGMIRIPGNNSNAKMTCGQINCHPGIPERIDSSLR